MFIRTIAPTLVAAVSFTALGCGQHASGGDPEGGPAASAGRHDHTHTVDGVERTFIVYVPERARDAAAPVVFMFHGSSQDGEKFYADSHWREKADETGLIAVFPTALTYCYKEDENHDGDFADAGERRVGTKWTHGPLGEPDGNPLCSAAELASLPAANRARADHPQKDDLAFVDAMLDVLATEYATDPARVYATGFSNGASFTGRLVAERPERFAAAGPGSGNLNVTPALAARPMSVAHWVGNKDDRFLPPGMTSVPVNEALIDTTVKARFVTPYLATLGLADEYTYSEETVAGKKQAHFTYATSTVGGSNSYTLTIYQGLFHQYPDGDNYPVAAADVLWPLFEASSL